MGKNVEGGPSHYGEINKNQIPNNFSEPPLILEMRKTTESLKEMQEKLNQLNELIKREEPTLMILEKTDPEAFMMVSTHLRKIKDEKAMLIDKGIELIQNINNGTNN